MAPARRPSAVDELAPVGAPAGNGGGETAEDSDIPF